MAKRISDCALELRPYPPELVELLLVTAGGCYSGRETLQFAPDEISLANVARVGPLDPDAASRSRLDHADYLKAAQRLTDRLPANPEPLRELFLPQPGAKRVLAQHDGISDLPGEALSYRRLLTAVRCCHG